jgi:hypothetical protein
MDLTDAASSRAASLKETEMPRIPLFAAASLGLAVATMAASWAAAPYAAPAAAPADTRLDLGRQQGDFYAMKQADGLHVVATFAEPAQNAVPLRFETVLAPGQTVTVSSPRAAGEPASTVALTRHGDRVEIHRVAAIY